MGGGGIMKSAEEVETTSFGSSFKKENSNTDSNSDSSPDTTGGDTEDDALSYFEKLANEWLESNPHNANEDRRG